MPSIHNSFELEILDKNHRILLQKTAFSLDHDLKQKGVSMPVEAKKQEKSGKRHPDGLNLPFPDV